MTRFTISPPSGFHFKHTIFSHGWYDLRPFRIDPHPLRLKALLRDGLGVIAVTYAEGRHHDADVLIATTDAKPDSRLEKIIVHSARGIFSFDRDLAPFYASLEHEADFAWMVQRRAGRMLCAPTFFEDVVKMILTTNCSWALTTRMCVNLIEHCSTTLTPTFPLPEEIAGCSEKFLRDKVKLGYRAPYVGLLARRVAKGELPIEEFRRSNGLTPEIYRELRSIKGVGDYAAANLLKLLGRFDYLGLDSWCRSKFAELRSKGRRVQDKSIERFYRRFGDWKGLVMWLDLTREWYTREVPVL